MVSGNETLQELSISARTCGTINNTNLITILIMVTDEHAIPKYFDCCFFCVLFALLIIIGFKRIITATILIIQNNDDNNNNTSDNTLGLY